MKTKKKVRVKKHRREKRVNFAWVYLAIIVFLLFSTLGVYIGVSDERELRALGTFFPASLLFAPPLGASFGHNVTVNLTIFDDTDPEPGLEEIRLSNISVNFFANYTDELGVVISEAGVFCDIRYDFTGTYTSPVSMDFNLTSSLWESNDTFFHKGTHTFEVFCNSSIGNIVLENNFVISNSIPRISTDAGGNLIDFDGNDLNIDLWPCVEDTLCVYNFSANVTEIDVNDVLTFGVIPGENTTLTNFTLDSSTGILEINVTDDVNTGERRIELFVRDTESTDQAGVLLVDIIPVNDPPIFLNLIDREFNRSELFEYIIFAEDEEDNVPFIFNIEFLVCNTAEWSTRGTTDCILFDSTQYIINDREYGAGNVGGEINISFTPVRNDVGEYEINFSVRDSGSPSSISSLVVNFTVTNINEAPYFTYVCDNERSTSEDDVFDCEINATDIDEVNNLTFNSNQTWFLSETSVPVSVATDFNASIPISFIPRDEQVGNWSINVSVTDTGSPVLQNSTVFEFFVENVNDSVGLHELGSVVAFTSNQFMKLINASDDDLLILDKTVYDESLTFFSNETWVTVSVVEVLSGTNVTTALVSFDPADFPGGTGTFFINISVQDANGNSSDSGILEINLIGNLPPVWHPEVITDYLLVEDTPFSLDLSNNVTDPDLDPISFDFSSDREFPSFSIGSSSGVIEFTPTDGDVGEHFVEINASDIAVSVPLIFNFTVLNVNDIPVISNVDGNGISIDASFNNMNTTEDAFVEIFLFVTDDDFNIPSIQQLNYYKESLSIGELVISEPNPNLFNFVVGSFFGTNEQQFVTSFTPNKTDVGNYTVSVNVTDFSGESVYLEFNLTINETQHAPVLENLTDQAVAINESIFYDINASDVEDGLDTDGNLTFSYQFLPDGDTEDFINGDEEIFNTTSGVLNATFNDTQGGSYHINITVTDTSGLTDDGDFWLFVSNLPEIISPPTGFVFNLQEGRADDLMFVANSTVGLNLTYEFYINDILRGSVDFYGNGTEITWEATPNFTDETYGLLGNFTLEVLMSDFVDLNGSKTWDANITHGNAPVIFVKDIGDKQVTVGQTIDINLTEHFFDVDVFDVVYNQSTNASIESDSISSGISLALTYVPNGTGSEWVLSLSASSALVEIINVTISDIDIVDGAIITNATSNNFVVEFVEPVTVLPPPPSSRSSRRIIVPFRIIFPDVVSARQGETLVLPIQIVNDGSQTLNNIDLTSVLAFEGVLRDDLLISLSKEFISSLSPGSSETIFLTVQIGMGEIGVYEITLNATVENPSFADWGKIYISVFEGLTIEEKLVFTEELIVSNPECVELKELIEESRHFIEIGEFSHAEVKLTETVDACRDSIGQRSLFSRERFSEKLQDSIFLYLLIATILALVFGVGYYVYRTIKLRRMLDEM